MIITVIIGHGENTHRWIVCRWWKGHFFFLPSPPEHLRFIIMTCTYRPSERKRISLYIAILPLYIVYYYIIINVHHTAHCSVHNINGRRRANTKRSFGLIIFINVSTMLRSSTSSPTTTIDSLKMLDFACI